MPRKKTLTRDKNSKDNIKRRHRRSKSYSFLSDHLEDINRIKSHSNSTDKHLIDGFKTKTDLSKGTIDRTDVRKSKSDRRFIGDEQSSSTSTSTNGTDSISESDSDCTKSSSFSSTSASCSSESSYTSSASNSTSQNRKTYPSNLKNEAKYATDKEELKKNSKVFSKNLSNNSANFSTTFDRISKSNIHGSISGSQSPRQIKTNYHTRSKIKSTHSWKICVGNLTRNVVKAHIFEIFSTFGEVNSIYIPLDPLTDFSLGCAYVEYLNADHAKNAIDKMDEGYIDGQIVKINETHSFHQIESKNRSTMRDNRFNQRRNDRLSEYQRNYISENPRLVSPTHHPRPPARFRRHRRDYSISSSRSRSPLISRSPHLKYTNTKHASNKVKKSFSNTDTSSKDHYFHHENKRKIKSGKTTSSTTTSLTCSDSQTLSA